MEMILNGGKEKFTNSKDLGVARDYKIDFEGISTS
jgi:excinuclease ABC subunit A